MDYIRINTLGQIPKSTHKIYFLAGCTDLYVQLKEELLADAEQSIFVDISGVSELKGIAETKLTVDIGALATFTEISESKIIRKHAQLLEKACLSIAAPQIRNVGTIGGNIANSSPAGDSLPALYALDAKFTLEHYGTKRTVAAKDFFTGPKKNILKTGEIVAKIIIPKNYYNFSSFIKLSGRAALAISKVSLAVAAKINSGKVEDIKISAGAVGSTVLRCETAEQFLKGKPLLHKTVNLAASILRRDVAPIDDIRSSKYYRNHTAGALLVKSLSGFLPY